MESELAAITREDDGAEVAMADLLCPICLDELAILLPPVRRTVAEIVNEWVEEWLTPDLLLIAMVTLMVLMQVGIILLLNLIYDHGEEYLVVPTLRPIMRVLTVAKLMLRLMAMIIQLNVQWLRSLAVPGEDQTQEPQI